LATDIVTLMEMPKNETEDDGNIKFIFDLISERYVQFIKTCFGVISTYTIQYIMFSTKSASQYEITTQH
jgi:hypothetical protein